MKIERPRPGLLQLEKSRARAAFRVVYFTLFFGSWYSVLVVAPSVLGQVPTFFVLLAWLAPLFLVPDIVRHVRVLASGETFTLNRDTRRIERNDMSLAQFSDVERVQIRRIHVDEEPDEYRLSIVLKTEDKIRIDQSTDAEEMAEAAEDIADMLGVEVVRKGDGAPGLSFGLRGV